MPASDTNATSSRNGAMPPVRASAFLHAGGHMAALIESADWEKTALGPARSWPQSLQTALRILVTSRYAMWMGWGPELTFFYNDAYAPTLGVKHPWALGQPASRVWQEIWPDIGPRARAVMRTGEATWDEGLLLFLERSGYPEETYHTFSYSPLPDDTGQIGGMLCVVAEETGRVIGERRLATLRELAAGLAAVRTEAEAMAVIGACLDANPRDLPFTLTYLFDGASDSARLACASGIEPGTAAPAVISAGASSIWPIGEILAQKPRVVMHALTGLRELPHGAWDKPPRQAVVVPITQSGQDRPAGMFVAALNPYRPYSESYAGFIDLVAAQIASGLASARAYEAERQRAEALAEIDRAKTAFFSNVSHEFRTPLTLMLGPLEEIMAGHPGDEQARLSMVHRNGLRLLRLVNTLLDFSRIEAGRVRADFRPTDLATYTADLASNFRSACERAGLSLRVDCSRLPQPVYADADMWERIVLNLLSNAFKYTLDGTIVVSLQPLANGAGIELAIQDTGVGIPEAEIPYIFDRFHRIEGQRGRTLEGTGIGLALVDELVRLHGGTIEVASQLDVGSRFAVRLPFGHGHLPNEHVSTDQGRSRPDSSASAAFVEEALRWLPEISEPGFGADRISALVAPPNAPATEQCEEKSGRCCRILLADDNADMRDYVTRLLRDDYDVIAVADGEAALQAARTGRPDLILSDVMMPRLDGFGLLAAIRAESELADMPVIMVSARAGDEARVDGLDAGADDYLVKPFSARELLARVRSNLELARLRQEAQETLRRMNDTLKQRVEAEIMDRLKAEEALRQSQKMEAVGHLTGGVAHDFNNLLTVITGGVETLQRLLQSGDLRANEPRVARAIAMITQGANRAATLTHRLLAFARRQTLDPQPLDLNKLVSGMSELLRRTLGEATAIEIVLAGGLWRTLADPNQLENALINLAVNARDAMPKGGKLTIETANTYLDDAYASRHDDVTPGQYVMVAVSDTGGGIPEDVRDRVFEPFFTTKDVGQGTGLGLSQVYGFIKQSRGHVKIYSEVGQGTAVKLYLPRLTAHALERELAEMDVAVPAGGGEVILVVEDDPDVREHSVDTLKELGYTVIAASDATSGLVVLDRNPSIRLLFTDVGLPGGMTGRQLADEARRRRPDLKVLYTTGYARNAIVHGGVLDPGTQLLPKPFSYGDVAAKIRAVLDE